MESILALFAEYGLLAVFVGVLVEQLGAPLPAVPLLVLAGAAAADDGVFAVQALAVAALASMLADSAWFLAGRRFGRRVLALLCRVSLSPDSCVRQSESSFARRGIATLVTAKFVPGLSTLAPPLAGALGMDFSSFAIFNLAGVALWAGAAIAGGMLFSDQVGELLARLGDLGSIALPVVAGLLALYVAARALHRRRLSRDLARLPRVRPSELAELIAQGSGPLIVDVRAPLLPAYDKRIPGARHIELAALKNGPDAEWPAGVRIVTYCACPNDASAAKAAHLLSRRGFDAHVLRGGIDAWADAGYPIETIEEFAAAEARV